MVSNPFQEGISVRVSGDASGLNRALDSAMGKLANFRTAALGVGGALAAIGGVSMKKAVSGAADFEQAMADVEKVTSEATAEELAEPIQEMAEDIPLAAEEIATLAAQAGRFGAEGPQAIEDFTRTAAEMGAATTLSSEEAGRSLAKVASAIGEPLENARELGDSINELSNNFATNSDEIVDAAQRGGFAVEELGLGSDQILALSAAMNEVAPSGRRAGNMMKQLGESLVDPGNVAAFAEVLGVTEEEFKNMRDESPEETMLAIAEAAADSRDASNLLADQLSSQQARAFQRLGGQADEFRRAMDMSNRAMEEGGSLAREVAIETDTFRGQMKLLKSEINNIFRAIGKDLLPVFRNLLEGVKPMIQGFKDLNDRTEGLAGQVAVVGSLVGGLGLVIAALVGGPITLAIGAIATLAAAWATGWEGIKDIVGEGVQFLTEQLGVVVDWLKANGPDIIDRAIATFETMVTDIAVWVKENGPGIIGEAWKAIGRAIRLVAIDIYNAITGNDDSLLKSIITDAADWIIENGPGIIKGAFEFVTEAAMAAFEGLYDGLIGNSLIPEMVDDIAGFLGGEGQRTVQHAAGDMLPDPRMAAVGQGGRSAVQTTVSPEVRTVVEVRSGDPLAQALADSLAIRDTARGEAERAIKQQVIRAENRSTGR